MKGTIKTVSGIVFGVLLFFLIQKFIFPALFNPSFDSEIMKFASELNKHCPFMVDSETRLDNAVAGDGKSIQYNYTLVNFTKEELDLDYFNNELKPSMLNSIKTNPEMKPLRDNGVTFVYYYKDKTGVHIVSLKFTPDDYNQ